MQGELTAWQAAALARNARAPAGRARLFQGDVTHLYWAAAFCACLLATAALSLRVRRKKRQTRQLAAAHRARFPDCPHCPVESFMAERAELVR